MSGQLPKYISPPRLVQMGGILQGRIPLAEMSRLTSALVDSEGDAEVRFQFGRDDQGIPGIIGYIRAELHVQCLRCLGPMVLPVDIDVMLGIVANEEQAARLPDEYEPLVAGDEQMRLADLVEDELILALPVVARHEDAGCHSTPETETAARRENPFAVLAQLKRRH